MRRLLTTLLVVVALLAALDRVVARVVTPAAAIRSINAERDQTFARIVAIQFDDLRANILRLVDVAHARWADVPDRKRPDELRVFVVGNSAAMFALVPAVLEERLAAAFPHRSVSVVPLLLPGIRIADEEDLVRAAVAKHADVIVLTPNLKGLVPKPSPLAATVHRLFGGGASARAADAVTFVEGLLERHWRLYRERDELRAHFVAAATRALFGTDATSAQLRALPASFAAIAASASRGDMHALVETYRENGMRSLIGTSAFRERLPPSSPVFTTMAKLARHVRDGNALGIAIFLPLNPIFRDAAATADFPDLHVDDAYVQALAARTVGIYAAAGFATFNRVDALPASGFIDLVHVNADGMEAFTRDTAASLVEAIRPVADSTAAAGAPAAPHE